MERRSGVVAAEKIDGFRDRFANPYRRGGESAWYALIQPRETRKEVESAGHVEGKGIKNRLRSMGNIRCVRLTAHSGAAHASQISTEATLKNTVLFALYNQGSLSPKSRQSSHSSAPDIRIGFEIATGEEMPTDRTCVRRTLTLPGRTGVIRQVWVTIERDDPHHRRLWVLGCYWDGEVD